MTQAVFVYDSNTGVDELIRSVSLLMLTPESKLSGYDAWRTRFNLNKPVTHKVENIIAYLVGAQEQVPSISVIKFPNQLKTDKHLLSFGESYLGCINGEIKKSELIKQIALYEKLDNNEVILDWLKIEIGKLKGNNDRFMLSDEELSELESIQSASNNPIQKWVAEREKSIKNEIKNIPKLLKRGF